MKNIMKAGIERQLVKQEPRRSGDRKGIELFHFSAGSYSLQGNGPTPQYRLLVHAVALVFWPVPCPVNIQFSGKSILISLEEHTFFSSWSS